MGLFDGLGGLRIALQKLHAYAVVILYISSEIDRPAKRLVRKRWPGVSEWGSVLTISEPMIGKVAHIYQDLCDLVILGAGSPCQDLSSLNAHRLGLAGAKSSLFFEVPKIIKWFYAHFGHKFQFFVENVFSMTTEQIQKFSQALSVTPVMIDGGNFCDAYRKRLYWCSWTIPSSQNWTITPHTHFVEVTVHVNKPEPSSWVEGDYIWKGPHLLPTLTRALPSANPPSSPAGIKSASKEAKVRWARDEHMFQVYQYEEKNMLCRKSENQEGTKSDEPNRLRLPTCEECEILMGIPQYYTLGALKEKFESRHAFVVRRQLLGNSFNCCVVSFLCGTLLQDTQLIPSEVPLETYLVREKADKPMVDDDCLIKDNLFDDGIFAKQLVSEYLRIAEKGGSDVRLDINVPFKPSAWPRAGAKTHLWNWGVVKGFPWKFTGKAHINHLELHGVFAALKWRTRRVAQQNVRFLHLVDSQVVGSILTKGRSSSLQLRSTLKRVNALVLAASLYPCYCFVSSEDNPADIPSRYKWSSSLKLRKNLRRRSVLKQGKR